VALKDALVRGEREKPRELEEAKTAQKAQVISILY
jgi:hypothetical protein